MPANRYYIAADLVSGGVVSLAEQEHHHLSNVMRNRPGDEVELVNGRGVLAHGAVVEVGRRESVISVTAAEEHPPPQSLILAQAIPRPNRLDTILEKVTELGVTGVWLFPGEQSEKKTLSDSQRKRADTVVIGAMKQSGSLWLPTIELKPAISKWDAPPFPGVFGDLHPDAPKLCDVVAENFSLFVVGPESGFTTREVDQLRALGMKGATLHPNILRTDTAAIAGIALLAHLRAR
jgi:16S rRNA (uracil1498-N3)-methyltransferase